MKSETYEKYTKAFGKEQADKILSAAHQHENGINSANTGSDEFRWALTIVIGYQCVEKFAEDHGITVPYKKFKTWVKKNGDFKNHDGDIDYLALFSGAYNEFVK